MNYPQVPGSGQPNAVPRSGPQIAEALRNAYHKILFPLEQQFRANIVRARANQQQQQQSGAMGMGNAGPGAANMSLEGGQPYQLAQMQRMAQLHQQNAAAQYQQRGLSPQGPGQQSQQQTSPQVTPPMASAVEQRQYAAPQTPRPPQQHQQHQQAGQPQTRPAPAHPSPQQGSARFTHVPLPSMGHMLTAASMNKQQLMTQMNFTEERAEYFLQFERPLIFERIRALQNQGQRQAQNQPPQGQPPQNQPPQNGAAPALTNGAGGMGAEAIPGTTQYLAQLQQQQHHQQQQQSQGPAFRTPQPPAAQPNQQAPGAAQNPSHFSVSPSQPQQQPQPSIQQPNPYMGMGRSLPTSIALQGTTPTLQNISLQNLTLADPKFIEFKRRWGGVAPQIRTLRERLQLNNSEFACTARTFSRYTDKLLQINQSQRCRFQTRIRSSSIKGLLQHSMLLLSSTSRLNVTSLLTRGYWVKSSAFFTRYVHGFALNMHTNILVADLHVPTATSTYRDVFTHQALFDVAKRSRRNVPIPGGTRSARP